MKLCFFNDNRLGLVEANTVYDVSEALRQLPTSGYPYPQTDALITNLEQLTPEIIRLREGASSFPLNEVTLLSPVANPGKIVAAPVNYQAHLDEAIADPATFTRANVRKIQETGLFLKATSSLIGAGQQVVIGLPERRTDHEIELVAVIGKRAKNVSARDALSYVAGYSIGLDITIRGPEERSLRKSLDTYTVLGPWLVTADELSDPHALEMVLDINGEKRQHANTRDLIMDVAELIEFASQYYTLEPGDLLFTGTPEGVAPIVAGDRINARIDNIGQLSVEVVQS
ncbi:fumarylacetoacetate hydrolase family protein [Pseudomonas sp. NPDC077186]|uniref:2-hydroxyhepta-2,4-diene-1,7-dioate isomerase n=1 Tax=Pseudomonas putida TaxID=303 RepID=A0A1L5PT90_PSEPU|nr:MULTISPECIES: fumarylacetoacetate hydrolase family protein [Pseudomonas]QPN45422.1 fumarylacetoacetate hydrolase family protein [Priestia aryabhattai]APO83359.1 2-hydroxyhepta-2,4-diene-1,7-dioate isomerase [Pseudomonas putida]KIY42372.1 2-hydroxyhepta-2,4-diene-1,7-dioate isomerase [Pseudomonas sp. 10-1B]MBA6136403.1 fumarylacetoacetate hydrolase family protein [Pseudomonas monteilii]MBF8805316.1 fumarylacetoacetate hydrolase family protein [Pseudomonas asiatica]